MDVSEGNVWVTAVVPHVGNTSIASLATAVIVSLYVLLIAIFGEQLGRCDHRRHSLGSF